MILMNPIISQAVAFTETFKQYKDAPVPIREAMCFKAQYPALLPDIREGDMFVGRGNPDRIVYVGSVWWYGMPGYSPEEYDVFGKQGGYCFDFSAPYTLPTNDEEKQTLEALSAFWENEATATKLYAKTDVRDGVGFLVANNLDRLVSKGLPGLVSDVTNMPESDFRTGLLLVLEVFADVCRHYQAQAEAKGYHDIANNLATILEHPPQTLAQALQLILIHELLSHEKHYEINRIDVALGDLYVQEIDNGNLTEEEAIEQILAFYRMVRDHGETAVCRLIMGGKHRRNEANADRFIVAALKAEQLHKQVIPQVSLRIYNDMNPELLSLAYETINETNTFPTLYNDDAIIDGVATAFDVSLEDAKKYYPLGCGEFIIAHNSPAILVAAWDVPRMVDVGIRASAGETFDAVYESILTQMAKEAADFATYHKTLIETNGSECAFLMASLLTDDCIASGKPLMSGGARFNGACVMGHGFTNAADALMAIKKLVYDENKYTLEEVLAALDANFEGHDSLHKALLAAPKYGNDHSETDVILARLWRDMTEAARKAGAAQGLDFLTVSSVNPGGYHIGWAMGATADGRQKQQPYAIGNAPTAGNDKNGLTALINSILKTDPVNGGSVTNFKVSREFFTKERQKFEALFSTYWAGGGLQANVTIINKGDLEAAMEEPEKFPNLLVRLGGWSARFIDLDRNTQNEILQRTLY